MARAGCVCLSRLAGVCDRARCTLVRGSELCCVCPIVVDIDRPSCSEPLPVISLPVSFDSTSTGRLHCTVYESGVGPYYSKCAVWYKYMYMVLVCTLALHDCIPLHTFCTYPSKRDQGFLLAAKDSFKIVS